MVETLKLFVIVLLVCADCTEKKNWHASFVHKKNTRKETGKEGSPRDYLLAGNTQMATFPNDAAAYVVGIVVGAFAGIVLVVLVGVCIYKQRRLDDQMKAIETEVNELRDEANQSRYKHQPKPPTAA